MKTIIERIRELREDHDLTQREIAGVLYVSTRAYSSYETGRSAIPIQSIIVLSQYYRVSVDFLFGLTDCPAPYLNQKRKE